MNETGSVKFRCDHVKAKLRRFAEFQELNRVRRKLVDLGMVGVDANGIGFGNLSVRDGTSSSFYITGTGTGRLAKLALADFSRVIAYDFKRNWLQCEGSTVASSESLTHAAVYESDQTARAVIHCHDMKLWSALVQEIPTTPENVAYGTPEMAYAVKDLFKTRDVRERKIFAMAAHHGGLVAFGKDAAEAFGVLVARASNL